MQQPDPFFALGAALAVLGARQLAFGPGVADHDLDAGAIGSARLVRWRQSSSRRTPAWPMRRAVLVQDAAVDAHELVLRLLAEQRHLHRVDWKPPTGWNAMAVAISIAADELSPLANGTVLCISPSKPGSPWPASCRKSAMPAHIVGPGNGRIVLDVVQGEHATAGDVERVDRHLAVGPRPGRHPGVPVDGHGQDVALVVVGVAAHQVDAARRARPDRGVAAEEAAEFLAHEVLAFFGCH